MEDLIVKNVDVMGDSIKAAKDADGNIWVGVRWVCDALDMTEGQMKRQIKNIKKDMVFEKEGSNQIPLPTDGGIKEGDFVVVETAPADEGDNGADYRDRAEIVPGHIQVNVGKGFYDFKWEQSLAGKKTGEQVMLPKRGKNQPGTIMQIKRRVYPELTDDIIKQLSIEGINTIPEYRAYLKQEMISEEKMRKSGGVNALVLKELTKSSVFGDLSEEITAFKEEFKEEVRERAERFQMSYEEMLAKRLPPYIKTPEQIEAFIS